jgi:hypothetical protein
VCPAAAGAPPGLLPTCPACLPFQVSEQLPDNDYYEYYEPDYSLNVSGGLRWLPLLGLGLGQGGGRGWPAAVNATAPRPKPPAQLAPPPAPALTPSGQNRTQLGPICSSSRSPN